MSQSEKQDKRKFPPCIQCGDGVPLDEGNDWQYTDEGLEPLCDYHLAEYVSIQYDIAKKLYQPKRH